MNLQALLCAAAVALSSFGCNALTGAGDLDVEERERHPRVDDAAPADDDDLSGPASSSATGGGTSSGGAGGAGSGAASSAVSTAAATTVATSAASGGVDCQYPSSGFGVQVGDVVKGSLSWQGYPEGASQSSTVSVQDYFDCDGSKGIHGILIISSATWCGVCQDEANDLPSMAGTFAQNGVKVITLMIEDAYGSPASVGTATEWKDAFGLDSVAVVADPNFSFSGYGSVGLPLQIVVDPRTMEIVARDEGFSGSYATVLGVASQNMN